MEPQLLVLHHDGNFSTVQENKTPAQRNPVCCKHRAVPQQNRLGWLTREGPSASSGSALDLGLPDRSRFELSALSTALRRICTGKSGLRQAQFQCLRGRRTQWRGTMGLGRGEGWTERRIKIYFTFLFLIFWRNLSVFTEEGFWSEKNQRSTQIDAPLYWCWVSFSDEFWSLPSSFGISVSSHLVTEIKKNIQSQP